MGRRDHNEYQIRAFLDRYYPNSAPGSPDPDQLFNDNKGGSRVILKAPSYKRIDSRYRLKDWQGNETSPAVNESFNILFNLLAVRSGELSELHDVATRLVLLNVNNPGGWQVMERLESSDDKAARDIGAMCRTVVNFVLDELDKERYWLDIGTDETYRSRRHEWETLKAAERRNDAEESYRIIYDSWTEWRENNLNQATSAELSEMAAKEMFREWYSSAHKYDLSPAKLYRSIAFMEQDGNDDDDEAA